MQVLNHRVYSTLTSNWPLRINNGGPCSLLLINGKTSTPRYWKSWSEEGREKWQGAEMSLYLLFSASLANSSSDDTLVVWVSQFTK